MGSRKKKRLPDEYQEVEYIESTGTQYIFTGLAIRTVSSLSTNWSLTFAITEFSGDRILCGANDRDKQIVIRSGGFIRGDWTGSTQNAILNKMVVDDVYTISQTDGYMVSATHTHEITTESNKSLPFTLFAKSTTSGTGVETSTIASARIYNFTATIDGASIANFIPCYRKSDNEIGMYDTVSRTFYTNAGTGTFLKGADV